MFARFAVAASLAFAVMTPALAAGTSGQTVIRFQRPDASDPAAVQRVLDLFEYEARKQCLVTGSLIANSACVDAFVAEAIQATKRESLRVALMDGAGIEAGVHVATAAVR